MPGLEQIGISPGVVLFALGAAVASALMFSAIGCIGLFRVDGAALPGERGGTMTPEAKRAASALVAAEIALAVVLLTGAGLTLRSFAKLLAVDPGFTAARRVDRAVRAAGRPLREGRRSPGVLRAGVRAHRGAA